MPTKQETFDKVVAHARKQGRRATTNPNMLQMGCRYRMPDGTMCFAGCLIPDDKYLASMEGTNCHEGAVAAVLNEQGYLLGFVRDLQRVHDCNVVERWEACFCELAHIHDLVYTPPEIQDAIKAGDV